MDKFRYNRHCSFRRYTGETRDGFGLARPGLGIPLIVTKNERQVEKQSWQDSNPAPPDRNFDGRRTKYTLVDETRDPTRTGGILGSVALPDRRISFYRGPESSLQ
jgi:hypothetical protein